MSAARHLRHVCVAFALILPACNQPEGKPPAPIIASSQPAPTTHSSLFSDGRTLEQMNSAVDFGDTNAMLELALYYRAGNDAPRNLPRFVELLTKASKAGNVQALDLGADLYQYGHSGFPVDHKIALALYGAAADRDDLYGKFMHALMLSNGWGQVPQFLTPAQKATLHQAALAGIKDNVPEAAYVLGGLYAKGWDVPISPALSEKWLVTAIEQGDTRAMISLAEDIIANPASPRLGEARPWLERAAETGDPRACTVLGYIYAQGLGVPRDYLAAIKYYTRAAGGEDPSALFALAMLRTSVPTYFPSAFNPMETLDHAAKLGNAPANEQLAKVYADGIGVAKNLPVALKYAEAAALQDDIVAQYLVAKTYFDGTEISRDVPRALYWFEQSGLRGNRDAINNIATIYVKGNQVPVDFDKAVKWYRYGAALGDGHCMTSLGNRYSAGEGVKADFAEAEKWYRAAIAAHDTDAYNNLGNIYAFGQGRARDDAEALRIYKEGADAGSPACMFDLYGFYLVGRSVPADLPAALELLKKAADANLPIALSTLGVHYESGSGVDRNYSLARELYLKAAALGDTRAMRQLYHLYTFGLGVKPDYDEAAHWAKTAVGAGVPDAYVDLAYLYMPGNYFPKDLDKAITLLHLGADAGSGSAMRSLGLLYTGQFGFKPDFQQAEIWFKKGAETGTPEAMCEYARYLALGEHRSPDPELARKYMTRAAEKRYGPAFRFLGLFADEGLIGTLVDYKTAMDYYQQAAALGDAPAVYRIGLLYMYGHGVVQDDPKAREYFERGAALHDEWSMALLGQFYYDGRGGPEDTVKGRQLLKQAADLNNPLALKWLTTHPE